MIHIRPIVCLITDFGAKDAYVFEMKGVMLSIHPEIRIIDISHEIDSGDVRSAAYVLNRAVASHENGCVYLAVVDPGVGSNRQAVILKCENNYFVCPDNGVFTRCVEGKDFTVRSISFADTQIPTRKSRTFHGRDLFAPVAARLASGEDFFSIGVESNLDVPSISIQFKIDENLLIGEVVYIDKFGNVSTNLPNGYQGLAKLNNFGNIPQVSCYSDGTYDELVWIEGSDGCLEIACREQSAADLAGTSIGDRVALQLAVE